MKLPPSKMDGLLEMVGKKLGVSPEQLRSNLESGKLEQAMQVECGKSPNFREGVEAFLEKRPPKFQ